MEPMSKGIHRALIPIESKMEHTMGVELMEASPGYHIFTQTDMVQFLCMQSKELDFMASKSVLELGAVQPDVYAAPDCLRVMDVVKCIRNTSLQAVAIVETTSELDNNATLVMVCTIPSCSLLHLRHKTSLNLSCKYPPYFLNFVM